MMNWSQLLSQHLSDLSYYVYPSLSLYQHTTEKGNLSHTFFEIVIFQSKGKH